MSLEWWRATPASQLVFKVHRLSSLRYLAKNRRIEHVWVNCQRLDAGGQRRSITNIFFPPFRGILDVQFLRNDAWTLLWESFISRWRALSIHPSIHRSVSAFVNDRSAHGLVILEMIGLGRSVSLSLVSLWERRTRFFSFLRPFVLSGKRVRRVYDTHTSPRACVSPPSADWSPR